MRRRTDGQKKGVGNAEKGRLFCVMGLLGLTKDIRCWHCGMIVLAERAECYSCARPIPKPALCSACHRNPTNSTDGFCELCRKESRGVVRVVGSSWTKWD